MFAFLKKLLYPGLGALVLMAYVYTVRRGIEPFEVSSERGEIPTAQRRAGGGGYRRTPTVFWFGGFGGK